MSKSKSESQWIVYRFSQVKNKKATINPINYDHDKSFQYTATVTLNQEEIGKKLKRLSSKCKWKGINYPLGKDDRKKFEKNNPAIALNVLYVKKGTKSLW